MGYRLKLAFIYSKSEGLLVLIFYILTQVVNSLLIFSSSYVVVVYDGNGATMKTERRWHLHFHR